MPPEVEMDAIHIIVQCDLFNELESHVADFRNSIVHGGPPSVARVSCGGNQPLGMVLFKLRKPNRIPRVMSIIHTEAPKQFNALVAGKFDHHLERVRSHFEKMWQYIIAKTAF